MKIKKTTEFNGDVHAWAETHDQYAAEDWLHLVLDGTYTVAEMRAAILADRDPTPAADLDAATKNLAEQVRGLPEYRGWYVTTAERDVYDMAETLVWKHDDNDTKIWLTLVRENSAQIDLSIDVDDPNDDPNCPSGDYVTLPEHTAAAVFAACKALLDEHSYDDDGDATGAVEVPA